MSHLIGIDFGGTFIKAALVAQGRAGRVLRARTPRGAGAVLNTIARLAQKLQARPKRVGVAIPGEVDARGRCWRLPNVPGFEQVAIARELEQRLGCPVAVENDATAAALAELRHGHGRRVSSFLLLTLGTGVGGGLCIDGAIRRGRHGFAGEIGHVLVDSSPAAWRCGCGLRGCMEACCGKAGLLKLGREHGARFATVKAMAQAAARGNRNARAAFAQAGRLLGVGLGSIQNTLDLDAIVFSGGIASSLALLAPAIRRGLKSRVFAPPLARVRLLQSRLGENAGIVGAALLADTAK